MRSSYTIAGLLFTLVFLSGACRNATSPKTEPASMEGSANRLKVIFDTDANNELDDQHALAYLLANGDDFELLGVTVNATYNGGDIEGHYEEAGRILQLFNRRDSLPLLRGANGNFSGITADLDPEAFDGRPAVDFMLEETRKDSVVIIAVGKLTNVALALKKDPSFTGRTRIVWLGSNYPEPGEYNQDNDTIAMNFLLNADIPFDMVTVRYGKPSGTDAVRVTPEEIGRRMPGQGTQASVPITGRHGGHFSNFGDYSVDLFDHIDLHGDPPARALFDMVAVAILKNPDWGKSRLHPAPVLIDNHWVERPQYQREIRIWEDFDKEALLEDFFDSMETPVLVPVTGQSD